MGLLISRMRWQVIVGLLGVSAVAVALGVSSHDVAAQAPPKCLGKPATIVGTNGNDTLNGTAGPDVIVGRAGNDTIRGRGRNDLICGNKGADRVQGHAGTTGSTVAAAMTPWKATREPTA